MPERRSVEPPVGGLRFLALPAVVALLWLCPPAAGAQMVACAGVAEQGFKVLLSDISEVGASSASPLMQPLIHRVTANLEQLQVETGLSLKVIRCPKRRPNDPSDFRRPIVQQLNSRQVVLEIWGTTTQATDPGGELYHEASIGYALIPVRLHELDAQEPPGAFMVPRRTKSVSSVDELLLLVDQAGELAAYTAASAGARLLRVPDYDQARLHLCRAEALLLRFLDDGSRPGDQALLAYVQQLAGETVELARKDPQYQGALKDLPLDTTGGCQPR
jgi:hypothetical protein